jgi:hypothetical protein
MRRTLSRSLSLLLGLGMVFIGLRFLLAPRAGADGVFLPPSDTQYAFHYAKGIRDVFSGLLLALFAGLGYDRSLAWVLLLGALIPSVDLTVVKSQHTALLALQLPHLLAIVLLLGLVASFFTLPRTATLAGAQFPEQLTRHAA